MPLKHSPSKKAFSKNVETEMKHGKPQSQSLAIAYATQRRARKKKAAGGSVQSGSPDMNMAEGGAVSAKTEKRPMPSDRHNDSKQISQNSGNKPASHDSWTDRSTESQAVNNSGRMVKPIKRPSMVPSDAFSTRLYDQEGNLMGAMRPGPYDSQPPKADDEQGPDRQGPAVPDKARQHNNGKPAAMYAEGGMAKKPYNDPMDDDQPSMDEGQAMAHSRDEEGQDRQGPEVMDMEDEHSTGRKPYAGGGKVSDYGMEEHTEEEENPAHDEHSPDDSEEQPNEEEHDESDSSIASAIMAKRKHPHAMSDSDMDEMLMLYEGGEITEHSGDILSHGSMDSDDSDQADLSRNHDEDANEEDQASFDQLRKENYNDSDLDIDNPRDAAMKGDSEERDSEDEHDMVSSIRAKIRAKRQQR